MSEDQFDRLLGALPKIAEAINAFNSEFVQQQAFEALIAAMGVPERSSSSLRERMVQTTTADEVVLNPTKTSPDGAEASGEADHQSAS